MNKKKITFKGGHITVRESTGQDDITAQIIQNQTVATYPPDAQGVWGHFAMLCSQTVDSAGLPFKPEAVAGLGPIDKRAAYEAYLRVPTALRKKWTAAVTALNTDDTIEIEDITDDPNP